MKYHSILTPALTSLCLLTSHNALAIDSIKAPAVKQDRWFEIEVIIFKQLSNNSENTEQFSPNHLSAKKRRAVDLLAPYLQPDIASLKKLLPICEQQQTNLPYDVAITPYNLWPESSETETAALLSESERGQHNDPATLVNDKEATSSGNMSVTILSDEKTETRTEQGLNEQSLNKQSLNKQSNQAQYATVELPVYNQYPIKSEMPLCVIPAEFFQQHLTSEQLESFSIDGFPVDKLTSTINGLEQWQDDESGEITWASNSPYLISQDSLRLKSIANRIKRSRNYAPLLHLGWRQIGESKRKAKAMKLYAGEHLDLRYQQAMTKQESEQQALEIQAILEQREYAEELIRSQINLVGNETAQVTTNATSTMTPDNVIESAEVFSELSIAEELRQQAKQQQLNTIFQQLSLVDNQENNTNESVNNEEYIKEIIAQLSSDITVKEIPLSANNAIENQEPVTAPSQPWSIDGLFKVHLDHYLYINTELNIIDSSNASSTLTAKQKLVQKQKKTSRLNKVTSFKQDRRVITGEIHYFDHPNIGMIVQIRRFDPTKPANEAVSQSKK